MKITTLYEDRENLKTRIKLVECAKLKYIHIYQFDDEGYCCSEMHIFNPESVEALTEIFTSHPDIKLYNMESDDFEPITHFFQD